MQRDMDLIRKILAAVRAKNDLEHRPVTVPGYEELVVNRHVEMLIHAGFLEGLASQTLPNGLECSVRDLTMDGHDFAAALDNETVWARMRQALSPAEMATAPLSVLKSIGTKLLQSYFSQKLGLPD